MSKKFKIWDCKILVPIDAELPPGFDSPPRQAAIKAVEDAGIEVLACSSGWGGTLSEEESDFYENNIVKKDDVYVAGAMDSEGVEQ